MLTGDPDWTPRDAVLLEVVHSRAVVSGTWKYIANRIPDYMKAVADPGNMGWFGSPVYDHRVFREAASYNVSKLFPHYTEADQLYDLEDDPCEQRNLAGDPALGEVLADMRAKLSIELKKLPHAYAEFT